MTKKNLINKYTAGFAALGISILLSVSGAMAEKAPLAADSSPDVYKVLAENAQMVVVQATWGPGQQDKAHSHYDDRASIYLTNCNLRIFKPDGTYRDASPKAGTSKVRTGKPVNSHSAKNMGDTVCKILLVELK